MALRSIASKSLYLVCNTYLIVAQEDIKNFALFVKILEEAGAVHGRLGDMEVSFSPSFSMEGVEELQEVSASVSDEEALFYSSRPSK